MALPNLTGQNIQDTYQRVVQTDGTKFYDGTGSLVQIVTDAVTSSMTVATASYAISASVEITHEVSSSYAQTASMASNNFIIQGHITASGDISASGTITTDSIVLGGNRFRLINDNFDIMDGGLEVNGNVTASGDISASGNLIVKNINGIINGGNF